VVGWLNAQTLLVEANTLNCTTNACNTQLLTVALDGSGTTTPLGEGTFLALAGGDQP
jgi:hypothetical protein